MAWFPDLAPFTGLPGRDLVAVGWLSKDQPYARGETRGERPNWRNAYANLEGEPRRCELCAAGDVTRFERGHYFVPGDGIVYVSPRLIDHYVRKHGYTPPQEFLAALETMPPSYSEECRAALSRAGLIERAPRTPERSAAYTTEAITVLETIEPVRLRPGMYIGGTDQRGLQQMLMEVFGNAIDQVLAGFARSIDVELDASGWITVEDDGHGIHLLPVAEGRRPFIEEVLTMLHLGPTADGHHPHVHVAPGVRGVGISVVNALSARMEVETRLDGTAWALSFECGRVTKPLHCLGASARRGTRVRFLPDDEIFDSIQLDRSAVELQLTEIAWLMPELSLTFCGRVLSKPKGIGGWLHELEPEIVSQTLLVGSGTSNDIGVEFAIAWNPKRTQPMLRAFVNMGELTNGGTHEKAFERAVRGSMQDRSLASGVMNGMTALVHLKMLAPRFGGPTKTRLASEEAAPAVTEVVREAIAKAPWFWDAIHSAVR